MTDFKVSIKRVIGRGPDPVYVGYVTAQEDGRRLWSESTGIKRLDPEDAHQDAFKMKIAYMAGLWTPGKTQSKAAQ